MEIPTNNRSEQYPSTESIQAVEEDLRARASVAPSEYREPYVLLMYRVLGREAEAHDNPTEANLESLQEVKGELDRFEGDFVHYRPPDET